MTRAVIRPRLERWMHVFAGYPARIIAAPSGTGKTTMLLAYSRSVQTRAAYLTLPEGCTPTAFYRLLATAIGAHDAPASAQEAISLIARIWRGREVLVDDADNAADETIEALLQMAREGENAFVLAGRSAQRMHAEEAAAAGYAVALDASTLAFDADEAGALARAYGVPVSQAQAANLVEQTDGWALALCAALETAQSENAGALQGFVLWRERSEALLRDLVEGELARLPSEARDVFWSIYSGSLAADETHLYALRRHGLHVLPCAAGVLRLFRPLDPRTRMANEQAPAGTPRMSVRMFGRFEAQVEGRRVPWVRRRDQEIFQYLLLAPGGRATREQLAAVFWPETPRSKASQSVRTACSTIRKAIAAAAGRDAGLYFRTSADVGIVLQNVVCDVRRFDAHCDAAQKSIGQKDARQAEMHLRACARLYSGALLEYDGEQHWNAARAQALADRYAFVLESLASFASQREARLVPKRITGRSVICTAIYGNVNDAVTKIHRSPA